MAGDRLSVDDLKARLRVSANYEQYTEDKDRKRASRLARLILEDLLRARGVSELEISAAAYLDWQG